MADYPVEQVLANIEKLAQKGAYCYIKYTCEGCGSRQTSNEANTWHADGYICEECQHLTVPEEINFMMMQATTPEGAEQLKKFVEQEAKERNK